MAIMVKTDLPVNRTVMPNAQQGIGQLEIIGMLLHKTVERIVKIRALVG